MIYDIEYLLLVYIKPVDSAFRTFSLAAQAWDSICYQSSSVIVEGFRAQVSTLDHFSEKELFGGWLSTGLECTKAIVHLGVCKE